MFTRKGKSSFIDILIYADNLILEGDDLQHIQDIKHLLNNHFIIKGLKELKYLLGLEVSRSSSRIIVNQRKYCLDLMQDSGLLASQPKETPRQTNLSNKHTS